MKIIAAPNLGGKVQDPLNLHESKKVPKEPGMIGGDMMVNSLQNNSEKRSKAINFAQTADLYKVRGAFVDKLA